MMLRPSPPYSFGQWAVSHPRAASFRLKARAKSYPSGFPLHSGPTGIGGRSSSGGRLAVSQSPISVRSASCAGVKRRSTMARRR